MSVLREVASAAPARKLAGALLLASAVLLGGCGQKGPLYLPDEAGSVVTRPAPSATAPPAPASTAAPAGKPADDKSSDKADKPASSTPRLR